MPLSPLPHVRGLLLAAGSGRRMGRPKALLRPAEGGRTLAERAVAVLLEGGCDGVTVVVGAASDEVTAAVRASFPEEDVVDVVRCADWSEGMGASLRAGLTAMRPHAQVQAVLVSLVDLPDLPAGAVHRVGRSGVGASSVEVSGVGVSGVAVGAGCLSRAAYGGVPGHPTLIGRDHWAGVVAGARGDRGARDYLAVHDHVVVECGDLATGRDVDSPAGARRAGLDASG
ncbi:nucleotidyltransferase family protein [Intrasporangium calvum]|uniref:MobA-like NTP transferase domain-containing protein n=1 Tax=Intrasporangium calvum (strain ATCC 23552 / DSM 43043 / JCM 3097 / NBRC 12989 / NCIMB 10167 / NRRL B-3866 / 7 KIP) TaxID=710696 RepID=E6SFC5_INTC7|nr:nucleotidyltransferase family protein [Intrasporangium calvum]ADU46663.1 hypothetical protein Intca_0101 [Intrasporangium calvum DSM 43043]